jgi:hypothetical protein
LLLALIVQKLLIFGGIFIILGVILPRWKHWHLSFCSLTRCGCFGVFFNLVDHLRVVVVDDSAGCVWAHRSIPGACVVTTPEAAQILGRGGLLALGAMWGEEQEC